MHVILPYKIRIGVRVQIKIKVMNVYDGESPTSYAPLNPCDGSIVHRLGGGTN